ncbi:MAG: acetate--CoA ligase family protein [Candidatus Nanohaloarchaea archaeon]
MELDPLFNPEKIAVIGASRHEGKTGHEIFDNLLHDFEGEVVPVNPNADDVHGVKAETETPDDTDLAVIAVPGKIVPDVMEDLGEKNVPAAIVISAGFSETGNDELEESILETADENDIALLGPNVLGLINTENSMNASFASKMPDEGNISFMSQSGAFCTAILDYAKAEHIGFRHFVSLGNKAQIDEVDLLKHWQNDETDTVISYTEGIENGRGFIEEAKKASQDMPIIMVKSGRTDKGGSAASSHTGSIAGSYEAYRAAFRKTGIIEAESNRELLDYGRAFNYQPLPEGDRVAIVTNAGGPGVITTDEIAEHSMELASFTMDTKRSLREAMPEESGAHNPLDVIGDAGHDRYKTALEHVLQDENVDAVIVILTPQANTEIDKTAKTIVKAAEDTDKPVMTSFMGEQDVASGIKILEENRVPEFQDPKDAVKTLHSMNEYRKFLERNETYKQFDYDREEAEKALSELDDYKDMEKVFTSFGFDALLTETAETPQEAAEVATKVGYPVVMKIDSPDIKHKTDIGAVKQGLESREEVKDAYHEIMDAVYENAPGSEIKGVQVQEQVEGLEIALGMKKDPQFGPMIMVGLGGIYIEVLKDVSFGIAPISDEEAEMMIDELESHEIFEGARGKDYSLEPVKETIMRLGDLALENDSITEIDLNPLILRNEKAYIADIALTREETEKD